MYVCIEAFIEGYKYYPITCVYELCIYVIVHKYWILSVFGIDITVQELPLFVLFHSMVDQTFRTKGYEIAFFKIEVQSREL